LSIIEVTGRISDIRAQLALLAPRPMTTGSTLPAGGVTAPGGDFAAVLARTGDRFALQSPAAALAPSASGVAAPQPADANAAGQRVVAEAQKYLGIPYLWGGTDPAKGLDCSGLVQLVYRKLGIELPRVSYQQATAGQPVASLAEARAGDILAFNSPVNHVGIYIGNNKMIEAPRTGLDVRVIDVYETPTAIRRVLPSAPFAVAGAGSSAAGAGRLPAYTPYLSLFEEAGSRYGVDPTLLAAVAKQESGFNPRAVSHAGAQGLMQLMPATAAGLGVTNSFDPAQAVGGAARLLRDLMGEFGRIDLALAAYNAGPGAVRRFGGIPPYAETQQYVRAVLAHKFQLEKA
jgi:cell wall-associated NlpC family hydrolase